MKFSSWLKSFLPFLSLWVILLITWPIESFFLAKYADQTSLIGNQIAHLIFMPFIIFSVGIPQALSHHIAHVRNGRQPKKLAGDSQFLQTVAPLLNSYLLLTVGFVILAATLVLFARPIAELMTPTKEIQDEVVTVLRTRALSLPIGYLAAVGDYTAFGLGLPFLANAAVILESIVFVTFVYGGWRYIDKNTDITPAQWSSYGISAKFASTVVVYFVYLKLQKLMPILKIEKLKDAISCFRKSFQNGLVSFTGEASRSSVSPILGNLAGTTAEVITLVERIGTVFSAFALAQRQFIFSRGSEPHVLKAQIITSLKYIFAIFIVIGGGTILAWNVFAQRVGISSNVVLAGTLPLVLRMVASFVEVVLYSVFSYLIIVKGEKKSWRNIFQKPGIVALFINGFIWVPGLYVIYHFNAFTPDIFFGSFIASLLVQITLPLLFTRDIFSKRPLSKG